MIRFSSFIFTTAFLFFHASSERAVDWFSINCPSASTDQPCTYTNTKTNDIAVSLFFQVEDNNGAWFQVASPSRNTRHRLLNLPNNTANMCPSPMAYSTNGQEHRCLFTGISFPSQKVQEYCDYLSQGYEGFTYPDADNPGYTCPSSFAPGKNSEGTDFCVYDIPKTYTMPKGARPYCSSAAFAAGELGFVWGKATPAPSHSFVNGSTVYCGRQWTSKQSGSAGDCFFILGAGKSFDVTGRGNVNMIGAHAVELNSQTTMKNAVSMGCPASGKKTCSYVNGGKTDMYISAAFRSTVDSKNWMRCSYSSTRGSTINVCAYSSINAQSSSSSCSFILPAGKRLTCSSSDGLIVDTVSGVMMDKSYLSQSEPMNAKVCPPTTFPNSTMCDCYYTNSDMNNDVAVIMEADNTDNQYNSFHCYVWGINVCAWGANSNNRNDSGSCYFVLPAGASYNCSMQWGATAFTSTTIMKLQGTLFKPPHVDSPQRRPKGVVLPPSRSEKETMALFQKWKTKFNKKYETIDEEQSRFENFRHFLSLADNMADRNIAPFDRLNEMADLSQDEFEKFYRGCAYPIQSDGRVRVPKDFKLPVNLPASVDWRTSGAIVPVKNQGQCGSCWAFSTTGVLSSTWYLKGNRPLTSLSEQTLVSCENDCDGCGGGWPYRAIDWVKQNGIDTEASYPYTSGGGNNGNCQESSHARANISVKGYKMLANNEDVMAAYVAQYGPVSISLDAMTQLWWPYTGGIMTGCCNKEPDHAVLIVGYGSQNGKKYWLIKNSWGTSWGIDGYIHLERGTDQCGITVAPVVPEM